LFSSGKRTHDVGKTKRATRFEKGGKTEKISVHPWRFKVKYPFYIYIFLKHEKEYWIL
jgi:hypothetical protein